MKNGTDNGTTTLFIRDLPRDLKNRFKSWCAKRGITMTKKIEELMRTAIKPQSRKW